MSYQIHGEPHDQNILEKAASRLMGGSTEGGDQQPQIVIGEERMRPTASGWGSDSSSPEQWSNRIGIYEKQKDWRFQTAHSGLRRAASAVLRHSAAFAFRSITGFSGAELACDGWAICRGRCDWLHLVSQARLCNLSPQRGPLFIGTHLCH